jgi:hypothetical protein
MAELTSLDLLLAAAGIGVGVWTEVIGSPEDRVEMFESGYAKHATILMLFLSATILLMLFLSLGSGLFITVLSGSLGVGGTALFLVIMAIALAGLPTIMKIYLDIYYHTRDAEDRSEQFRLALLTAIIGG